jgi:hypothetical protein
MALTQAQRAIIERARSLGGGDQAVLLDDDVCAYLVAVIGSDLDLLKRFPDWPQQVPSFFETTPLSSLRFTGLDFVRMFEQLLTRDRNADTYFMCLAALHKARLKYERILETQPVPTIEQVGPRGLLQFGSMSARALTALLLWRKWIFDIDNRAGQETGYLFEPIIAASIGGAPASAKKSPVKRRSDNNKGRQVDCIRGRRAYEIKLRVTIAASGQGRWSEELEFPVDCRASGYTPVLVVLDSTPNPKLSDLVSAFEAQRGETYIGSAAWRHLEEEAGATMARFLETYVRQPLKELLNQVPQALPELVLKMNEGRITFVVGGQELVIRRASDSESQDDRDETPDDADEPIPGV